MFIARRFIVVLQIHSLYGDVRVANVVVTSHGPRHLRGPAFYSHYSLLQTIQRNCGQGDRPGCRRR